MKHSKNTRNNPQQVEGNRLSNTPHSDKNKTIQPIQPNLSTSKESSSINVMLTEFREFKKTVDFISKQYDDILRIHQSYVDEIKSLKKELADMNVINNQLREEVNVLQYDVNNIYQQKVSTNIVIFGASKINNQDELNAIFGNILDCLKINKNDVGEHMVYQRHNNNNQSCPIFVELKNTDIKTKVLQTTKLRDIYTDDVKLPGHNKLWFKEQLTPFTQNLLKNAIQLRNHGYKFIWSKNGKVFARKTPQSELRVIKSMSCIELLKNLNCTI